LEAMDAVLAPGGCMLHKIDLRDHGLFSEAGGHPLEFLTISDGIYGLMTRDAGRPNRYMVPFYREWLSSSGYDGDLLATRILGSAADLDPHVPVGDLDPQTVAPALEQIQDIQSRLASPYRESDERELAVSGVFLVARKPEGATSA